MTSQMGNVELVTTADVVAALGRSNSTIMRMVEAGELTPVFKANGLRGAYLFDRSQVEALAEAAE